jgi:hypothetical protein
VQAFDAAIELMRAAELKDEAAEREHCQATAVSIGAAFSAVEGGQLLMRERAAARAEVEAKYAQLSDAFIALQNEHALLVAKTK